MTSIIHKYFKISNIIYPPYDYYSDNYNNYINLNGCYHWKGGDICWYKNGEYHREDGPAFIGVNGRKEWYLNDKLHREDGPAIIDPNGYEGWYLNGKNNSIKRNRRNS